MKFLDVKTDFAFKKVFGSEQSQDILISFLNAIIYIDSPYKIQQVQIVDPYSIPLLKGMKDTYVDIKAVLDNGSAVIIEMQVLNHAGFEKRILYNAAKNYSIQLKKGEDYTLLNPVIALTIADFTLFQNSTKLINRFKLIEKENLIEYSDDIELIFVELPKFNKVEADLKTIQDKWLYFIQQAETLNFIPQNLNQELEKAFAIINEANLTEAELEAQHKRKDFIYMQKSAIKLATQKGHDTGLEQGINLGIIKVAKTMLDANMEISLIEQATGLSATEIQKLKNNKI